MAAGCSRFRQDLPDITDRSLGYNSTYFRAQIDDGGRLILVLCESQGSELLQNEESLALIRPDREGRLGRWQISRDPAQYLPGNTGHLLVVGWVGVGWGGAVPYFGP